MSSQAIRAVKVSTVVAAAIILSLALWAVVAFELLRPALSGD